MRNWVPMRSVIFVFFTTEKVDGGIARPVVAVALAGPKCSGSGIGKSRRIDPRYAALVEFVRDAGKRIADLVRALFAFAGAAGVVR